MKIAIVDCGTGNLLSVQKALAHLGVDAAITTDAEIISRADGLVFPGVGAWDPAITNLRKRSLEKGLLDFVQTGKPFLGICLGAQLLHESSEEGSESGLKLIPGKVIKFRPGDSSLKVPHMGWNSLKITAPSPLLRGLSDGAFAYFVHSYYFRPDDREVVSSTTDYDVEFASSVWKGNIFGTQFHPEKSGEVGRQILVNFLSLIPGGSSPMTHPQ